MASDLLPVLDGLSYEALPLHARLARATLRLAQTQRPTQRLRLRPLALGRGDVKVGRRPPRRVWSTLYFFFQEEIVYGVCLSLLFRGIVTGL